MQVYPFFVRHFFFLKVHALPHNFVSYNMKQKKTAKSIIAIACTQHADTLQVMTLQSRYIYIYIFAQKYTVVK